MGNGSERVKLPEEPYLKTFEDWKHCSSYSDYGYHFKGFLIGCIYTTLMALIFAGIDYALLYFLMWK